MELLGIGPLEVLLVVVLALVLFGPREIAGTARSAGRFLNRLYRSEGWRTMTSASSALRNLPSRLAREAELQDLDAIGRRLTQEPPAIDPDVTPPPAEGMQAWAPPRPPARPPQPPSGPPPAPDSDD